MRTSLALCAIVALLSCSVHLASGHTYLDSIVYNGQTHTECMRPHRSYEKENPIATVASADMTCGFLPSAAQPASAKCPIPAGTSMSLQWWHTQPGDDVIADTHKGPCMIYLAKSDTGAGPVWFKIFESGLDIASQTWCVDTLIANRGRLDFVLPANLQSGNYLLRGEVIALHNGYAIDGSQPYVGCAEITVTGSGTSFPSSDALVSFPGAYKNTDPGLYPVSLYNGPLSRYIIPGPAVWGGSSTPVKPSSSASASSSSSSSSSSGSTTPGGGGGGSSSLPSASSAATCGAVTISTNLRAGASWGNPPHNIFDITVVNRGSSDITDLVLQITLNAGATQIDEVWNMHKTGSNYVVSEPIKAGKTYTGAGYIIFGGSASVQIVCASNNNNNGNTGSYSYASSSSSSSATTSSVTTGTAPNPATVTSGTPVPPATTGSPAPAATTGAPVPAATTGSPAPAATTGTPSTSSSCRAGISFTLSNSWNNGGMVGIVISNTGTKPITSIQVQVNVDNNSWNLQSSSTSYVYSLPSWAFPLAPGARFDAAGYTFNGPQPAPGSVLSVAC